VSSFAGNLSGSLSTGTDYSAGTLTNCNTPVSQANCSATTLNSGANVTLMAGSQIVLGPGFTAQAANSSTSLVAQIGTPPPNFTLSLTPGTAAVLAGSTPVTYTVTVGALYGFTGAVTFAVSGLPSGATASFSPSSVSGSGSTTLSISAPVGTAGNYGFTVSATSGSLAHTGAALLSVQDFTWTVSPTSQSVIPYPTGTGYGTYTITATGINGFNSPITPIVSACAPPAEGTGMGYWPGGITGSGTTTFSLGPAYLGLNNTPIPFCMLVTGSSGGLSHQATVYLTAAPSADFSLGFSAGQVVPPPGTASYTVAVSSATSPQFAGTVNLCINGLPAGVTSSFGATNCATSGLGSLGLTLTAAAGTLQGTYPITITGVSGALEHFASTTLTILGAPDFSVSASPAIVTIVPGGTAIDTIVVNVSQGFAGTVVLSASGLPAGVAAAFNPPSITGSGLFGMTLTASFATSLGTTPIIIAGQSGTLVHTIAGFVTVGAPAPGTILSPFQNAVINGGSATFIWSAGVGVSQYVLSVGSGQGMSDLYLGTFGQGATTSPVVTVPTTGTVWARLTSTYSSGTSTYSDYHYGCGPGGGYGGGGGATAVLTGPSQATLLDTGQTTLVGPYYIALSNGVLLGADALTLCQASNTLIGVWVEYPSQWAPTTPNAFDLNFSASSTIAPGQYSVNCKWDIGEFGLATLANGISVYDATPVISGVSVVNGVSPNVFTPGVPFTVAISGANFGANGTVVVCALESSTGPCSQTTDFPDVHMQIGWNPEVLLVTMTSIAGAVGQYCVQVKSLGASGLGFAPAPGGGSGNTSNCVGPIVPNNLQLRVGCSGTSGQCPASTLSQNQCVYIDKTPHSPILTAQVLNSDGSPASGTASYTLTGVFDQSFPGPTYASGNLSDIIVVPEPWGGVIGPPALVPAGQVSPVPWQLFGGGQATVNWTYNGTAGSAFNFCVLGMNPDLAQVQPAAQAVPYWFAPNIGVHETNLSQFCDGTSRTNVGGYCNSSNTGMPDYGPPGGYGIFQFDPPPSLNEIWNWTANVAYDQTFLYGKAGPVANTNDSTVAYPFWIRQVNQWVAYNASQTAQGLPAVGPPPDQSYFVGQQYYPIGPPPPGSVPTCRFTLSPAPAPNYTAPTSGGGVYWFGDAIAMKRVGGAPQMGNVCGDYVCWDNVTNPASPQWSFYKANTANYDVVGDFCSCGTPGPWCQHSSITQ
jgi:hypothetical protein